MTGGMAQRKASHLYDQMTDPANDHFDSANQNDNSQSGSEVHDQSVQVSTASKSGAGTDGDYRLKVSSHILTSGESLPTHNPHPSGFGDSGRDGGLLLPAGGHVETGSFSMIKNFLHSFVDSLGGWIGAISFVGATAYSVVILLSLLG